MPGRTLPELLLLCAILAVLAGSGVRWAGLVTTIRQQTLAADLHTAVQTARATAVQRRRPVTLCPLRAGRCRRDWPGGWSLFMDADADGRRDPGEALLRVWGPLPRGTRLVWRAFRNRPWLTFDARGWTANQNGHFLLCPPGGDARRAHQLIVNRQGRVRAAGDRDGDGVREDARGRPLRCIR